MMRRTLLLLGLHLDQQTGLVLWSKGVAVAALVAGGVFDPADVLYKGFGLMISMGADARIKWWCVAIGAVVGYFSGKKTIDHP